MNKYYTVKNEHLAKAIAFVTGQRYMIFNDLKNEGEYIYSFENTDKLREVKQKLNELKEIYTN
jgi:hypothetical protein